MKLINERILVIINKNLKRAHSVCWENIFKKTTKKPFELTRVTYIIMFGDLREQRSFITH